MSTRREQNDFVDAHVRALDSLRDRDRYRKLVARCGLDFSSNDYLGLAASSELSLAATRAIDRGVPVGATGSRLLRGHHEEHEALEIEAAQFFGSERALYFSSGFGANYALFSTLPARGDLVVYDEFIHASVHDGLHAGHANCVKARHNDPQSFLDAVQVWRGKGGCGRVWLGVESLYSMDGDRAPIDALYEVANSCDGFLVVDEAHASGVWGREGRGFASHLEGRDNVITMHTCGKALGVMGGLVCARAPLIEFLVNRARAFIYATAPSPLVAAVLRDVLRLIETGDDRRKRLHDLIDFGGGLLSDTCGVACSQSQIQPVILKSDAHALEVANVMQKNGFDVRAIRPPTVPRGTSRLRISFTLNVTRDDVQAMALSLDRALRCAVT